eukprot:COSAG04_NODE_17914_length_456_cov_0.675070_1_plen_60_part_10
MNEAHGAGAEDLARGDLAGLAVGHREEIDLRHSIAGVNWHRRSFRKNGVLKHQCAQCSNC